jgi:hypothetical protein
MATSITKLASLNSTASKGGAETSHLLLHVIYAANTDPKGYEGWTSSLLYPTSYCGRFSVVNCPHILDLDNKEQFGSYASRKYIVSSNRKLEIGPNS